jgi:hypothetical protein
MSYDHSNRKPSQIDNLQEQLEEAKETITDFEQELEELKGYLKRYGLSPDMIPEYEALLDLLNLKGDMALNRFIYQTSHMLAVFNQNRNSGYNDQDENLISRVETALMPLEGLPGIIYGISEGLEGDEAYQSIQGLYVVSKDIVDNASSNIMAAISGPVE